MQKTSHSLNALINTSIGYGTLLATSKVLPSSGMALGPLFSVMSANHIGKNLKADGSSIIYAFIYGTTTGLIGGGYASSSLISTYFPLSPNTDNAAIENNNFKTNCVWVGGIIGAVVGAGVAVYSHATHPGPQHPHEA